MADPAHARAILDQLADDLRRHDELYYRNATPEISDADYDEMRDRYLALADELALPAAERYGQTPGDDHTAGFTTIRHRLPMLSLEKAATDPALVVDGRDLAVADIPLEPKERKRSALGLLEHWETRTRKGLGLAADLPLPLVV